MTFTYVSVSAKGECCFVFVAEFQNFMARRTFHLSALLLSVYLASLWHILGYSSTVLLSVYIVPHSSIFQHIVALCIHVAEL